MILLLQECDLAAVQSLENSCPKCEPHNEWSEQLFQMCLQRVLQALQGLAL